MYPAGHFFATQQLQQVQLAAANVPNNPCTGQDCPKDKNGENMYRNRNRNQKQLTGLLRRQKSATARLLVLKD